MRETAKTMTLRLNAAEYAHLCQQAEVTGLKKEPLVRQLIMGVNLRPRPPDGGVFTTDAAAENPWVDGGGGRMI